MNREFLKDAANQIKAKLPDGYGFILLASPHDNPDGTKPHNARVVYISNIQRPDAIGMLKEWLLKCGAAEDWMQHIK